MGTLLMSLFHKKFQTDYIMFLYQKKNAKHNLTLRNHYFTIITIFKYLTTMNYSLKFFAHNLVKSPLWS